MNLCSNKIVENKIKNSQQLLSQIYSIKPTFIDSKSKKFSRQPQEKNSHSATQ